MNTLYIDTHSDILKLVIFQSDGKVTVRESNTDKNHSALTMPLLVELLKEVSLNIHDISDIILINGPGSFTGIRIGTTIAKVLAVTLNIPIRVMSSLLIKAVSNLEYENHWFAENEKNGYYVAEYNPIDELLNDYFYIKNADYEFFLDTHSVIEHVEIDYLKIYQYSRKIRAQNPHTVNPFYVKLIEVQK